MEIKSEHIPLYRFFTALRSLHPRSLGLEEYLAFVELLQLRPETLDSPPALFRACKVMWMKPGFSEVEFAQLFRESLEKPRWEDDVPPGVAESANDSGKLLNAPRELQSQSSDPATPGMQEETIEREIKELYLNILREPSGQSVGAKSVEELLQERNFQFNSSFPGMSLRRLAIHWSRLAQWRRKGYTTEMDLEATISEVVRTGYFREIQFKRRLVPHGKLILLVDCSPRMEVFASYLNILKSSLKDAGLNRLSIYSFNWLPKVSEDRIEVLPEEGYGERINLGNNAFRISSGMNTRLLVFSDAGAATGRLDLQYIEKVLELQVLLNRLTSSIIWINPLPENRWKDSSAEYIRNFIHMVECSEPGIAQAVSSMRNPRPRSRPINQIQ